MSTEKTASSQPATTASQTRRTFLQRLGLGSLAVTTVAASALTALAPSSAAAAQVAKENPNRVKVFRLRSRKTVACHACQLHHRHLIFLTKKAARHHRAHPGCDCPISAQWIKRHTFRRLFNARAKERGFVDLRKV